MRYFIIMPLLCFALLSCSDDSSKTPAVTITEVSSASISMRWEPVYHNRTFEITRTPPWSDAVSQKSTANLYFTDTDIRAGGRYHYTVCARLYQDIQGGCSFWIIVEAPR